LIDLESWAKYVLIQQLLDNFDFNIKSKGNNSGRQDLFTLPGSNYAYKNAGGKIKAGPLWDLDLSAGVTPANFPKHYQIQEHIMPRHVFYKRLWTDPVFLAKFKKTWDAHQDDFNDIPGFIDSISRAVGSKVQGNVWHGNSQAGNGTLTQDLHNTEVSGFKTWWSARLAHFGNQLNAMNIDVNKDTSPVIAQVNITIFNLKGNMVRKQEFAGGNYTVKLDGLPKGMYIAKVSFGNGRAPVILKLPVR
jgi:hypothetical protein